MFWRYFMWNFSGRQNDKQGYVYDGYKNGNWITGIPMIDAAKNPQLTNIPKSQKNVPTRNSYFMLPLVIGLLGLAFHVRNHKRGFFVVFMLFFFLGFMNILNMNQPPIEPRERDYALAGAFFAFAMWVGFGVLALYEMYLSLIHI